MGMGLKRSHQSDMIVYINCPDPGPSIHFMPRFQRGGINVLIIPGQFMGLNTLKDFAILMDVNHFYFSERIF